MRSHGIRHRERVFPRCDFPVCDAEKIAAFIASRLADREPASLLRLGDGEGMVLAKPTLEDSNLWPRVRWHFGPGVTSRQIEGLAEELSAAIYNADAIGIRDDLLDVEFLPEHFTLSGEEFVSKFKASFKLRPVERNIGYPDALRLAFLHQHLSRQSFRQGTIFGSAWIHYELSASRALVQMIRSAGQIGLIGWNPELARRLARLLNIDVDYYHVPNVYASVGGKNPPHFPGKFELIMKALKVTRRGQLFLVGAGVCGKVYCQRIKELGGVSLDIGSVCDAWLNIASRPLVFKSLYNVPGDEVPEGLLLESQLERSGIGADAGIVA